MIKLRYYVIAIADVTFLQIVHKIDWSWFDESMKRVSIVMGVIVGIITIVKGIQDFLKNRIEIKNKALDLKRKDEEIRRFFEQKYNDQ
jgi:hypothetical protein